MTEGHFLDKRKLALKEWWPFIWSSKCIEITTVGHKTGVGDDKTSVFAF